jgi:hypothetical protein
VLIMRKHDEQVHDEHTQEKADEDDKTIAL